MVGEAGAHLVCMNEGVEAVVSTCSDAARSTQLLCRCRMNALADDANFEAPQNVTECMRHFLAISCEHIRCTTEGRYVGPIGARVL